MESKDGSRNHLSEPERKPVQEEGVKIALGGRSLKMPIEQIETRVNKGAGRVAISGSLASSLGLPRGAVLNVRQQDGVLRLGPLVGIITVPSKSAPLFGEQEGYFRHLLKSLAGLNGFGYIFTPSGVDWEGRSIIGYYTGRSSGWQKARFPLPDVIYNRCLIGSGKSTEAIEGLAALGVNSFNTSLGSKWRVYQMLKLSSPALTCLPETILLDSSEALERILKSHHDVYVKSLDGHLGKGIYRISKGEVGYRVQRTGETHGRYVGSVPKIIRMYGMDKKYGKLIAQKSIKPGRSGSHFDIRVLVQKDGRGCWRLTGMAVRMGLAGQITTNLHTGGRAESLEKALRLKGYNVARTSMVKQALMSAALQIAKALEHTTENLGELGLDFVLDAEGRPWFLEANPRAGRRSFARLGLNTRRLAVRRPMEYACHLAGFELT
ncbi:MAG: YheC/YheD family protein [Syntrophomonadaceae bacterium]